MGRGRTAERIAFGGCAGRPYSPPTDAECPIRRGRRVSHVPIVIPPRKGQASQRDRGAIVRLRVVADPLPAVTAAAKGSGLRLRREGPHEEPDDVLDGVAGREQVGFAHRPESPVGPDS